VQSAPFRVTPGRGTRRSGSRRSQWKRWEQALEDVRAQGGVPYSMAGLIDLVRAGEIGRESNVLYAHLGGQPALNAYSALFRG